MRAKLITAVLRLLAWMPLSWNRRLAALIGRLLYLLPNSVRRDSSINIRLCLPELSEAEHTLLLKLSLIETCKTALEAGPLWFWPAERSQALMRDVINAELIAAAQREGRGVILATPHLGSWEISGQTGATLCPGMTILYRPPRIAALDKLTRTGRARTGGHLVATDAKGVKQLYQTLSKGGVVGILPDQDPGTGGGIFAPFFGIQANSMLLLGRLAHKTGARVFFCYSRRLPGADGYVLKFCAAPEDMYSADSLVATTAMNKAVEQLVRECPEQYQWSYRRFRTRPPGEPRLY